MLSIRDLTVSFTQYDGMFSRKQETKLNAVNLEVRPGEIVAVCGESGAGKSLLASALIGQLPGNARTTGSISWRGPHEAGRHVRLIPQGVRAFDPTMTIGRFVGNDAALDRFGLAEHAHSYPSELSGGQLRRALLATSVGEDTRFVIADEPTPGLHAAAVDTALDYFAELRRAGTAVLLITHDLVSAQRVADRMLIMRRGEIVDEIDPAAPELATGYSRALWDTQPANAFWRTDAQRV